MDFGGVGAGRIELCWRSALPRNPVSIVFSGEDEECRQMVEVSRADTWESRVFRLDKGFPARIRSHLSFAWVQP